MKLTTLSSLLVMAFVFTSCNPQEKFYDKAQLSSTAAYSESGVIIKEVVDAGSSSSSASSTCSVISSEESCKEALDCQPLYEEDNLKNLKYLSCTAMGPAPAASSPSSPAAPSSSSVPAAGHESPEHEDEIDHDDSTKPKPEVGSLPKAHSESEVKPKPAASQIPKSCDLIAGEYKLVVGQNLKVKVCHRATEQKVVSIVISCSALASHIEHHEDELGVCSTRE